jgi:hypothetical protein
MLYTTLNNIREFSPCEDGWRQLLTYLNKTKAEDESLDFKTILQAIGIKDTIWCLRTQEFKDYYKFVTRVARVAYSVLPIFEKKYPNDQRPRSAIEAVDKFMNGEISKGELEEHLNAVSAADAAAAAYAADAAAEAAAADSNDAAYWAADAAANAANAAATAAYAAYTAWGDAYDAREKKRQEIEQIFIEECLN